MRLAGVACLVDGDSGCEVVTLNRPTRNPSLFSRQAQSHLAVVVSWQYFNVQTELVKIPFTITYRRKAYRHVARLALSFLAQRPSTRRRLRATVPIVDLKALSLRRDNDVQLLFQVGRRFEALARRARSVATGCRFEARKWRKQRSKLASRRSASEGGLPPARLDQSAKRMKRTTPIDADVCSCELACFSIRAEVARG